MYNWGYKIFHYDLTLEKEVSDENLNSLIFPLNFNIFIILKIIIII
jgi:hypothetical protein